MHETDLQLSPNEASDLSRVFNPETLAAQGWDRAFATVLDEASAEDALALLDEQATTRALAPVREGGEPTTARQAPATAVAARDHADAAVRRVDEVIRRPWFLPAAGFAAVVLLAVIVIALAGGGESPQRDGAAASPAPAAAPLDEQLRGLDRAIDAAASR